MRSEFENMVVATYNDLSFEGAAAAVVEGADVVLTPAFE